MSSARNTKTKAEQQEQVVDSSRVIETETALGPATMLIPVWPEFPKEVTEESIHELPVEQLKKFGFVKEISAAIEQGIFYDHWHHPGAPYPTLAWTRRKTEASA